jgi:hypothetical protein
MSLLLTREYREPRHQGASGPGAFLFGRCSQYGRGGTNELKSDQQDREGEALL